MIDFSQWMKKKAFDRVKQAHMVNIFNIAGNFLDMMKGFSTKASGNMVLHS